MSETAAPQLPPQLPARRRRRTGLIWGIIAAIVVIVVVVVLVVANGSKGAGASGAKTVSIGTSDASDPTWTIYKKLAKEKYNVDIKLVNFSDYSQPNPALAQNQIDLNEFQHIEFLAVYNVTNHQDIQPIGATVTVPLPLYSLKYKSVADLPAGAKVAIPNDQVNQARGLLVLQSAGLVTLKNGGTAFSTVNDITSKKVTIETLDAAQTAPALKNGAVDASIINNNYAVLAKLPTSDVIAKDDPSSEAAQNYVNFFAARKADIHNKLYLELAALYHNPAVEAAALKESGGTAVFSKLTPAQLQAQLKKTEADARAAGIGK
ncbi:MetQ/NlpA family ABC transporter substrate-binding protein [Gryllotalpicola reticulitermitis]|uniref:MetQ/NlpA family ABC transporter substrate-binding protein n=1 Tax=Gryllotalpicola reticulitermitis TaxID=1184153 RepID=A0ABV8Q459_9MICO